MELGAASHKLKSEDPHRLRCRRDQRDLEAARPGGSRHLAADEPGPNDRDPRRRLERPAQRERVVDPAQDVHPVERGLARVRPRPRARGRADPEPRERELVVVWADDAARKIEASCRGAMQPRCLSLLAGKRAVLEAPGAREQLL